MSRKAKYFYTALVIITLLLISFCIICIHDIQNTLNPNQFVKERTEEQNIQLQKILDSKFPERTSFSLSELPYNLEKPNLKIHAESAIIVDTVTGSILYEKNADQQIPPASLTKIVEMYVLFQAVENHEVSLDDIVPLPPQSWSENLPSDASRMYLGRNHRVTLRELMLGLAIASGNDASIAAAYYVCGNMEDFVKRMNDAVASIGLTHTHFVESSGYSELNTTTAREFATFARMYINKYPESLSDFHSKSMLKYPAEKNLPPELKSQKDSLAITQHNTNKLLGKIPGCDGLKTGYIDESGYNISVTAQRNNNRFLSVTMRGPGKSTAEGNTYRVSDNLELFNYAFSSFADYNKDKDSTSHEYAVGVTGADQKYVILVPALSETFTVPFISGESPVQTANSIQTKVSIPNCIQGSIEQGKQYGTISYQIGDITLRTIPLVADRDIPQSNIFRQLYGKIIYSLIQLDFSIKSKRDTNS